MYAPGSRALFRNQSEEEGWDPEGYRQWLMLHFPLSFPEGYFDQELLDRDELAKLATDKVVAAFKDKMASEDAKAISLKHSAFPVPLSPPSWEALRQLMIRKLDHFWQEHLLAMDHLRVDVNLRTVGNRDPLTEFKHEAFALFDKLGDALRADIAQNFFKFQIKLSIPSHIEHVFNQLQMERNRSLVEELEAQQSAPATQHAEKELPPPKLEPVVVGPRVGRNDDCPCGSGKKYKKCCGTQFDEDLKDT